MINEEFIKTTYAEAIGRYGRRAQQAMAIEEMSELIKAICKLWRYQDQESVEAIREEMADVEIMLDQMKMMFGDVSKIKEKKIHRLFHRLKKEVEE